MKEMSKVKKRCQNVVNLAKPQKQRDPEYFLASKDSLLRTLWVKITENDEYLLNFVFNSF